VELSCSVSACSGTVQFTAKMPVKSVRGTSAKTLTTLLAGGRYAMSAGARSTVMLALSAAGRKALSGAVIRPIHGTLTVTVGNGATIRRAIDAY